VRLQPPAAGGPAETATDLLEKSATSTAPGNVPELVEAIAQTGRRDTRPGALGWAAVFLVAALVGAGTANAIARMVQPSGLPGSAFRGIGGADVHAVLDRVLPAVVAVSASTAAGRAVATGMLISGDGEILTNSHVVAGATSVSVTRYGTSRPIPARLVGSSATDDLALIKLEGATSLPTVHLAGSSDVRVGDAVLAIGNASGLAAGTPTVTQGIISAVGRTTSPAAGRGGGEPAGLLQTDAAISPGNSGGPLINATGEAIGVTTAVAQGEPSGNAGQNIGFAIPSIHVRAVLDELRTGGVAPPPADYLGLTTVTVGLALRQTYGLAPSSGALVIGADPESPAAAVGLTPGDVIVAIDSRPIAAAEDLARAMRDRKPGERISLEGVLDRGQLRLSTLLTSARMRR
jgi:S1-C subfamily serine protease